MTPSSATKPDGTRCKGQALPGAAVCWAHDPAHAEARRRIARQGGQTAGQGRPAAGGQLATLRALLQELTGQAQAGTLEAGRVYALNALINTRLRLVELERKLKETEELE